MISIQLSERITSLRWLCIVLVLMQHAVQWPYYLSDYADFCFEPVFSWIYMFVVYGLGIGIVPVFFIISGYLQFSKPRKYKDTVLKKIEGLMLPILIWTAIAYLEYIAMKGWTGRLPKFENSSLLDWLRTIFGDYSSMLSGKSIGNPLLYQFWFIRDLFVLSILSPLINWLLHKIPWIYITLCLLAAIFDISPLMAPHALLFYSLGGLCAIRNWDFFSLADKWIPWPLVITGCIAAIFFVHNEGLYCGITSHYLAHLPTFFLLLKFSRILIFHRKVYAFFQNMAPQSMFLYCSHGYMILYILGLWLIRSIDVTNTLGMIVFALILFAGDLGICTLLGVLIRKYLPKTFSILSGGR